MSENILKEEYSVLSFDTLDSNYGKNINTEEDEDLIVLLVDNEKIYLKRVYG